MVIPGRGAMFHGCNLRRRPRSPAMTEALGSGDKYPRKTETCAHQEACERASATAGSKRRGTKQEAVLALLEQTRGATIPAIMKATGWQAQFADRHFRDLFGGGGTRPPAPQKPAVAAWPRGQIAEMAEGPISIRQ